MAYISKRTLHYKSRFILKGQVVPSDYKRLAEGIKRCWIVDTDGPAASPSLALREVDTITTPATGDSVPTQPVAVSTGDITPDELPEYVEPAIEDLDYLMPMAMAKESLEAEGVVTIRDLEGWDVEALDELRGIGVILAERLLSDYAEYAEWKEKFKEYAEVPIDARIEVVPAEDANAESETGEDESPEDD